MTIEMTRQVAQRIERAAQSLHLDLDALATLLDDAVAQAATSTVPLTESERAILAESGVGAGRLAAAESSVGAGDWSRAIAQGQVLLARQSVSVKQAAAVLGKQESTVRRALMERRIWSFRVGGMHRIPTWQLQDESILGSSAERAARTHLLDHLADLVVAIPARATAAQVQHFMTTPDPDLDPQRPPVAPVDWVRAGEPVGAVVDRLHDLVVT